MSRAERVALLDREPVVTSVTGLSVRSQTQLLELNRSSLYYRPLPPSAEEVLLKRRIDEIYTAHPFYGSRLYGSRLYGSRLYGSRLYGSRLYGSRRIAVQLHREGYAINRKTVAYHMREMGLFGIAPGPNLSRSGKRASDSKYPYLLKGVVAEYPNHVWGVDLTYIRMVGGYPGWLYLVAVLDWHSRYIVSWELSQNMGQGFVMDAARAALVKANPTIWNSDQGSHFTSPQYTGLLEKAGVQISMDGRGRFVDNIFTERLWRTIKYEEVYLHEYSTPREARQSLGQYIDFYNNERPHQALDYQTPAAIYHRLTTKQGGNLTLENASHWS